MDELEKKKNIEKFLSENHFAQSFLISKEKTAPAGRDAAELFKKRLNDYDSSLFEETSIKKIDNPSLKLETEIERVEEAISALAEKLVVAEAVQDTMRAKEIFIQKLMLEKKLEKLHRDYKSQGFDTSFTQGVISFLGLPANVENDIKNKIVKFAKNAGLVKPFQPVMNFFRIKETLNKLDKINKSVDELVSMKVPFGEDEQRYQALANHLTRANCLQNKIEKEFKG